MITWIKKKFFDWMDKQCRRENLKMLNWSGEQLRYHKKQVEFYQKCVTFYENSVDKKS
jgi:hypothetical protein